MSGRPFDPRHSPASGLQSKRVAIYQPAGNPSDAIAPGFCCRVIDLHSC